MRCFGMKVRTRIGYDFLGSAVTACLAPFCCHIQGQDFRIWGIFFRITQKTHLKVEDFNIKAELAMNFSSENVSL